MRVSPTPDGIWALASEPAARGRRRDACRIPGFATDFMPMAVALLAVADGSAIVTENVYDGRFQFVDELARMGADVRTEGRHAIVRGVERLSGAPVRASDVRAGAALVLAGLWPTARPIVHDGEHVDRGYPDLAGQLRVARRRRRAPRRSDRPAFGGRGSGPIGNSRDTGVVAPVSTAHRIWRPAWRSISPSMEDGILEAIDAIRPALQSDGGDIVFNGHRRRRRRPRLARRRVRHLPGLDDDAQGRRRADHHGPCSGRHRGRRRRVALAALRSAMTPTPARSSSARSTATGVSIAKLLSLVEAGRRRRARRGRSRCTRTPGDAWSVGITGAPGAGKSTLTDALVGAAARRRRRGRRARRRPDAARSAAARSSATACACRATRPTPASSSARWRRAGTSAASRSRRRRRCACSTRSARRGS